MPRSYKPEVFVQGQWSSNALRFADEDEALQYARDLLYRWTLCQDSRATPCEDEATHWLDMVTGRAHAIDDHKCRRCLTDVTASVDYCPDCLDDVRKAASR